MNPAPPGTSKVVRLMAGAAARRFLNHTRLIPGVFARRKKRPQERKPSPRRSIGSLVLAAVLAAVFLMQAVQISTGCLQNIAGAVAERFPPPDDVVLAADIYADLKPWDSAFDRVRRDLAREDDPEVKAMLEKRAATFRDCVKSLFDQQARRAVMLQEFDSRARPMNRKLVIDADEAARIAALSRKYFERFESKGLAGFRSNVKATRVMWPSVSLWPRGEGGDVMVRAAALFVALLSLAAVLLHLGLANRDLGRTEWDMEWLFTFPVSSRSIFLARILAGGFTGVWSLLLVGPFMFVVFWSRGYKRAAVLIAGLAAACLSTAVASLCVLAEAALRRRFSLSRLKTFQAVASALSAVLLYLAMSFAFSGTFAPPLARLAGALPDWTVWAPLSLPAAVAWGGVRATVAVCLLALSTAALAAGAARACEYLVRDGLIREANVHRGTRSTAPQAGGGIMLTGIVGKEVRLLMRDKSYLIRVVALPLLAVAFQFVINPAILKAGWSDFRHACAIAYGVGGFALFSGAIYALLYEGKALWLLFTFPCEIESILRRKAVFWSAIGLFYTLGFLAIAIARSPAAFAENIPSAIAAAAGVIPLAFMAVGIGAIGVNPLSTSPQRMSIWVGYLFMFLASVYVPVIYVPYALLKAAGFGAWLLVAWFVWRLVSGRLPKLLDSPA